LFYHPQPLHCHPRAGGDPGLNCYWIPPRENGDHAGMIEESTGMTEERTRMTEEDTGMYKNILVCIKG